MQKVPAFAVVGIAIKLLVTGYAPDIGGNAILLFKNLLRLQYLKHDRAAAQQLHAYGSVLLLGLLEAIQAFQDSFADAGIVGRVRHGQWFVGNGQVIEDRFLIDIHALDAILNDDGDLIRERRVVCDEVGHRQREYVAMAVLVLQAFSGKSGAAGGAANEESAAAHVCGGPDQIADSLKAEHGVVNEERNRVDAVVGIGRARRDERAHGTSFGNSFLQNLAALGFFVVEQRVHVHGLIKLAHAGVNSNLAEQRFHAEGAGFVGHNRNDQLGQSRIAQKFGQQPDKPYSRRSFEAVGSFVEFFEVRFGHGLQRLGPHFSLRQISSELLPPRLHILDLRAVVLRAVERRVV